MKSQAETKLLPESIGIGGYADNGRTRVEIWFASVEAARKFVYKTRKAAGHV